MDSQKPEIENGEMESREVTGLGALLKSEREKNGLSHEQVARITRLRKNVLEALENEDWENLPPPVFIKGFIRAYARALDLDERKALDLYEETAPVESESPEPLVKPITLRKRPLFLLILLLGVIAAVVYLSMGHLPGKTASTQIQKEDLPQSREVPNKMEQSTTPEK